MIIVNAHCHLYNHPNIENLFIDTSNIYISTALTGDELNHHLAITNDNFLIATGQHPLYPCGSITPEKVVSLCESKQLFAVGEIGFDKRNKDKQWQNRVFLSFADIANQYQKPVIIHCVGRYYELYSSIKKQFPHLKIILHGFNGSIEILHLFLQLNTIFSIHKNILKVKNRKNILKAIFQTHRFLFETDTDTDCSVMGTILTIAKSIDIPVETLLHIQEENFQTCVPSDKSIR